MLMRTRWLLAIIFVGILDSQSLAVVVYDESNPMDGELSTDNLSPTVLGVFMPGTNTVTGQVQYIGDFFDGFNFTADIFTFEIAAGQQLDSIVLTSFSTLEPSEAVGLILDDGSTFEYSVEELNDIFTPPDTTQILGGTGVGLAHIGTDILDDLHDAVNLNNGSVFDIPLRPGHYSIYIQENDPGVNTDYSLAFNVSTTEIVPEPSSASLMAIAGVGFAAMRRRRRKRSGSD